MCAPVLQAVRNRPADDAEVGSLDTALRVANVIPRSDQFIVAFLGEQGIGKSSLVCSVLNRDIVNVSASSSACTAYPTLITHKAGASDEHLSLMFMSNISVMMKSESVFKSKRAGIGRLSLRYHATMRSTTPEAWKKKQLKMTSVKMRTMLRILQPLETPMTFHDAGA